MYYYSFESINLPYKKILRNNMHVRASMLNTQQGCPAEIILPICKCCDYLNIPAKGNKHRK
ncbi:hypothetical protein H8356DRAFT_1349989 [Neocallimastix lanati (nom. inval.)]|nr:hypothetical protein H8356DRAFT_1349989 [Neocallimastix sp. JGI-2020a]